MKTEYGQTQHGLPHPDQLNIIGLVIQTAPGKADQVRAAIAELPGVDVHTGTEDGRIVATAIDTDGAMAIDQLAAMNRTPGIVSTMLAYHQIERAEAEPVAAPCGCNTNSNHSCATEKGFEP